MVEQVGGVEQTSGLCENPAQRENPTESTTVHTNISHKSPGKLYQANLAICRHKFLLPDYFQRFQSCNGRFHDRYIIGRQEDKLRTAMFIGSSRRKGKGWQLSMRPEKWNLFPHWPGCTGCPAKRFPGEIRDSTQDFLLKYRILPRGIPF